MTRAQIQQQLVDLDRQINEESAKNRVPSLNLRNRSFPWAYWVSAAVFLAAGLFGGQFLPQLHAQYGKYALIIGAVIGISGAIRTVIFFVKGRSHNDKGYAQATEKIRQLQEKRQELQKQLKEI